MSDLYATLDRHRRRAEELLLQANHWSYGDGGDPVIGQALATEAQAHATLALVEATRLFSGSRS